MSFKASQAGRFIFDFYSSPFSCSFQAFLSLLLNNEIEVIDWGVKVSMKNNLNFLLEFAPKYKE